MVLAGIGREDNRSRIEDLDMMYIPPRWQNASAVSPLMSIVFIPDDFTTDLEFVPPRCGIESVCSNVYDDVFSEKKKDSVVERDFSETLNAEDPAI